MLVCYKFHELIAWFIIGNYFVKMAATIRNLVTVYCCGFILNQIGSVQPELINGLLGTVGDLTNDIVSSNILSNVTSILQSPLTRQLCGAETVIKDIWIESMTMNKLSHFFSMN